MQSISEWLRPHLDPIALAIVATLLVIFGGELNRWVRKAVRRYHFIVRLMVFILVCAVGYGVATVFITELVSQMLGGLSNHYLALVVALIFIGLGLIAEERNQL